MTPSALKETLLKQYNEQVAVLQQLQGALAACDQLLAEESTETTDTEEE